jgi:hypothetical protein
MAQDWIKVCKDTPDKPEIRLLAKHLKVSKELAFAHWFRLYAWADGQTHDGWFPHLTLADVAESAGVPILACRILASAEVGWLMECSGDNPGVLIRHWEYHNGDCAKKRAMDSIRAAKYRAKKRYTQSVTKCNAHSVTELQRDSVTP